MPSSRKTNRFLFTFLLLLVVLGGLSSLYFLNQAEQPTAKLKEKEQQLNALNQQIELLFQLFEVDDIILTERDYKKALSTSKEMLNDAPEEHHDLIRQKIEQIEKILQTVNTSSDDELILKQQLEEKEELIKSMRKQLDGNGNEIQEMIDSLHEEITELKMTLAAQKENLDRKERIKVLTFSTKRGNKVHYLGEAKDDKANGGGVGIWATGSIYKGEWLNNQRHGKGTFEWESGETYTGEYKYDTREGKGTYSWPSGERYEGDWKNDKRNGKGILYDLDGNIRFEGKWENDKPIR